MRNMMLVLSLALAAACMEPAEMADAGSAADADVSLGASEWSVFFPDAGNHYAYRGCASETHTCPWDATYVCAKTAIARRYAACSAAADCVHVEPENDPITVCPPVAINSANEADFRADMQVEIDRYDAVSDCRSSGECIGGMTVDCIDGLCAWVYPSDAGL